MRFKTTLFLIVLLAVIVFLVYEFGDDPTPAPQTPERLFPGVVMSSVDRIELGLFAGFEAVLERHAGRWKVIEPYEDEARLELVQQLLAALEENVKVELPTRDGGVDLVAKQLNPPARWIDIRHAGGRNRINVGALDPLGSEVFVTLDQGGTLFRTGRNLHNFLERNPNDFRDARLFRADPRLVDQVLIERAGAIVLRAEKNRGQWKILEPILDDADSSRIYGLVNNLTRLDVGRIAVQSATEEQIAECGLTEDMLRVVLKSDVLGWGVIMAPQSIGPSASLFCMRDGGDQILTLERSKFSRLEFALEHYRSTIILPKVRENVTSIAVLRGDEQWLLLRREDKYFYIDVPFKAPADQIVDGDATPLSLYMSRLFSLQASAFVADDAKDLSAFGLEKPEWTLFIRWERGNTHRKIELRISAADEGVRHVFNRDKPMFVYAIKADDIGFIAEDSIFLRDKRIFNHDINKIMKAAFTLGERSITIERPGPGKYFEGDRDNRFQELMHELKREVVAAYEVGGSGKDDPRFATVWGSVTYFVNEVGSGPREIKIEFGQETPEGYYGRSSDMIRGVFVLKKDFFGRFAGEFEGI